MSNDDHQPALAALREDQAPPRDLWPAIAARIADPEARGQIELPASLASELKALRVDAVPPPALWDAIAGRIANAEDREHCALPQALQARLAALPKDTAPARDLWPAIAARSVARPLATPRRRPRLAAFAAAASLVAAVALIVQVERPLGGHAAEAASPAGTARVPLRPSAEVFAATIGYTRGGDEAAALQRASYRPMSREARALVRANLKIVNTAEAQIEKAIAADPDDAAYLQALLDSARQHQQGLRAALVDHP